MKTNYPNVYRYFTQVQLANLLDLTLDQFKRSKKREFYLKMFDRTISITEDVIINKIKMF